MKGLWHFLALISVPKATLSVPKCLWTPAKVRNQCGVSKYHFGALVSTQSVGCANPHFFATLRSPCTSASKTEERPSKRSESSFLCVHCGYTTKDERNFMRHGRWVFVVGSVT